MLSSHPICQKKTFVPFVSHRETLKNQGETGVQGSRDAIRLAFRRGLILSGEVWMNMIKSRNRTSHTYNATTMEEIFSAVRDSYFSEFVLLEAKFHQIENSDLIDHIDRAGVVFYRRVPERSAVEGLMNSRRSS